MKDIKLIKKHSNNCPIIEKTADGVPVGRCWFYMQDGKTCPRHGNVEKYILYHMESNKCH